ncbi:zf-HC2 domain-containing protein, partial [Armatimonas sp.]|uniref:zf-HC2 domain-containing protein n=1 Tax=Armatimonas sp. TaxID=1872638 RepID=UPI00286A6CC6
MLKCQSPLQEDLKAYLDSELPPVRHAAVAKHLLSCPACQSELAALRLLSTQLTEALPAPAPLSDALRARILATLPETPQPRPLFVPFWRRPRSLAFGGVLAAGCAFWLWARVPESKKMSAPAASVADKATNAAPAASITETKAFADNAAKPTIAAAPEEVKVIASPIPSTPTPAPLPTPLTVQSYNGELKSALKQEAPKKRQVVALAEPKDALAIPTSETQGAEESAKKKEAASPIPSVPAPASVPMSRSAKLYTNNKATAEIKAQDSSGQLQANISLRVVRPAPTSYTLTIPTGKRTETLETIQKLAEELSMTVGDEQPDLNLRLAPEKREALLERLKALGALTETPLPPAIATFANPISSTGMQQRSAVPSGQGGGGFGGSGALSSDGARGGFGGGRGG